MTFHLSDQAAFSAVQSILKVMMGAPLDTGRRTQQVTRLEILWKEMLAAGDLLIAALRLEQEFSETDCTQAEGEVVKRWRLDRSTVESIAENYSRAVSKWREALKAECRASARCDF